MRLDRSETSSSAAESRVRGGGGDRSTSRAKSLDVAPAGHAA